MSGRSADTRRFACERCTPQNAWVRARALAACLAWTACGDRVADGHVAVDSDGVVAVDSGDVAAVDSDEVAAIDSDGVMIDSGAVADTRGDTADALVADEVVGTTIERCDGTGPGNEDCHFRALWRPDACAGGPCDVLVVYWSGGEQSCADGTYDALLERWATSGVVIACAQPFTTSDEAGRYPYADEGARMDRIMGAVRDAVGAAWSGRTLVIAGVSHGATAPVAAIAEGRRFATRPELWTGRERTAVILFDGITDPARLEASVGLSDSALCKPWHARFVGRYGEAAPLLHACDNGACYCAGGGVGWARDTTVVGQVAGPSWPASPYACGDLAGPSIAWRVVSCGGGQADPCGPLGDIIPDDQQTRFVDALATCGADVTYDDHPGCAHVMCGGWDFCGGEEARTWIDGR